MRIDLDFLCALADLIIVLAVVTIKTITNMFFGFDYQTAVGNYSGPHEIQNRSVNKLYHQVRECRDMKNKAYFV